jgi:hypothetical protein
VKRPLAISLALVFSLLTIAEQKARRQRNRPPSIDSFTSSSRTLNICQFTQLCDKPEVGLLVNATDPDGDALQYEYSPTEGSISGKGKSVIWNLNNVLRGPHEVRVTVTDGKGGKVDAALTVITADSDSCDPPPPPCPIVKVSCPEELDKANPFVFSALVEGDGTNEPTFHWKLNAGRIVKGQGGREIEATTTGANGFDGITATVEVGGFDPSCITLGRCTTKIIW